MRCGSGRRAVGRELDAVDDVAAIGRQRRRRPASRCRPSAAWRTGRPCGRPSPPGRRRRRSAPPPSAAARGRCRGCCWRWNSAKLSAQSPPCSRKARPSRDLGERRLQAPRLAGEDQRRIVAQRRLDGAERRGIGIVRRLLDRLAPPAIGAPFLGHHKPHRTRKMRVSKPQSILSLTTLHQRAAGADPSGQAQRSP